MIYDLRTAKRQLSRLIEAADAGEDVVIARGEKPVARLLPVRPARRFRLGILAGKVGSAPDFLKPMSEEDWNDI
ncbi:MAG: type II toxin-antitoxin system prevent-host-death family antitoxin [Salinarimonadaceae bacterium]|nr:MAG: type II toxin-antitoxin system prevent-host-death family antitoxin [Salinarimonadaceae bacterium]